MDADPWLIELIAVKDGSRFSGERQSLSRDAAKGLLVRVRLGVYVDAAAWTGFDDRARHIVRMRALVEVSVVAPVFSHWSAAVALGLPVPGARLDRVHVTRPGDSDRAPLGIAPHFHPLCRDATVPVHGLLVTDAARTVVDVAGASSFGAGVSLADAALRAGTSREQLLERWDEAGMRRAHRRTEDVILFAHPGAESPNESESRVSMCRLGVEPPVLQVDVFDGEEFAGRPDFLFPTARAAGEADGAAKYLDPALAPQGAGQVLYREKLREERLRLVLNGLARWGWAQSCDPALLRPVLARIDVRPAGATFADYCGAAAAWQPGQRLLAGSAALR